MKNPKGVRIDENFQAFHITWATHNSRYLGRMTEFVKTPNKPFIFPEQMRNDVFHFLSEKITEEKYFVFALNVLKDHVHCVLVCSPGEIAEIVRKLKGFSSVMLARQLKFSVVKQGRQHKVLARGYSATLLESEEHLGNAIEYVRLNHVKHDVLPLQKKFVPTISLEDILW